MSRDEQFLNLLEVYKKNGKLPLPIVHTLKKFYATYTKAICDNQKDPQIVEPLLINLVKFAADQIANPFSFDLYHSALRKPFDYYRFGLDFMRPLIDMEHSSVSRSYILNQIDDQLACGENVILLANHQIEPDPQVISILLEKNHPQLAEEIIIVAGHRVITDPLAVPFSKGRNLLCIFSKKHIENPPEQKHEKLQHNQKTMKKMSQLLTTGGKCIYVAPSGGRDRIDSKGKIAISKFDPQSIEFFYLMAKHSEKPCHFYPLTLKTYHLLPPPQDIEKQIGEVRFAQSAPAHLVFGEKLNMEIFPGSDIADKKKRRKARADYIWGLVQADYQKINL